MAKKNSLEWQLLPKENIEPLMGTLVYLCQANLDCWNEWDRGAILAGLEDTDVEANRWFDYELSGTYRIGIRLSLNPRTDLAFLQLDFPREKYDSIFMAVFMASCFLLKPRF